MRLPDSPRRLVSLALPLLLVTAGAADAARGQNTTRRMSVTSAGVEGSGPSQFSDCDLTGRRVVFSSQSKDLVPGDGNFAWDIFLHDQKSGVTQRVNLGLNGEDADNDSFFPSISDDGRYVAFESEASNLVFDDKNGRSDVFVVDRVTGVTTRASVNSFGGEGDDDSHRPHLSADGRFVAFESDASNLVSGDTNGVRDIFVHDLQNGTTVRASVSTRGGQATAGSRTPRLNGDGSVVVFASDAENLVADDSNGHRDVFHRDLGTGVTTLVSRQSRFQGDADSDAPDVDASGDQVVFESQANNLLPEDLNGGHDVFVKIVSTGALELISVTTLEESVQGAAVQPTFSATGAEVAFTSYSSLLVDGDRNGERDVFVRDRLLGTTQRISLTASGGESNGWSDFAQISADGAAVAFHSPATNLVSGDLNGQVDVYLHGFWINLEIEPLVLYEFDPFELYCYGGRDFGILLLQVIAVNGTPFRFNLDTSKFDSRGGYSFVGVTPPGLSGIVLDVQLLGEARDGRLRASNIAQMRFR